MLAQQQDWCPLTLQEDWHWLSNKTNADRMAQQQDWCLLTLQKDWHWPSNKTNADRAAQLQGRRGKKRKEKQNQKLVW